MIIWQISMTMLPENNLQWLLYWTKNASNLTIFAVIMIFTVRLHEILEIHDICFSYFMSFFSLLSQLIINFEWVVCFSISFWCYTRVSKICDEHLWTWRFTKFKMNYRQWFMSLFFSKSVAFEKSLIFISE